MLTTITIAFLYLSGGIASRIMAEAALEAGLHRKSKWLTPAILCLWPLLIWASVIGGTWKYMRNK